MPGVPLDAKNQVKKGFWRLFSRRPKDDDEQPDSSAASDNKSSSAERPAHVAQSGAPEHYDDEVEYEPAKPSEAPPPTYGHIVNSNQASHDPGNAGTPFAPQPSTIDTSSKPPEVYVTPASASSDAQQDQMTSNTEEQQKEEEVPEEAMTPKDNRPNDTVDLDEGSPVPKMSATSGPLEDNPTL